MKKIIHIVLGKANPDRLNGVNKMVHHVAEIQTQQKSIAIEVWGITDSVDSISDRPYTIRLFKGHAFRFIITHEMKNSIDALAPGSIIHFHGCLISFYTAIARYIRRRELQYIVTPHGCFSQKSLHNNRIFKSIYTYLFDYQFLQHAKAIQAITHEEKHDISLIHNHRYIHLVPNGLPSRLFKMPITKNKDEKHNIIFGYMGRFDIKHKNLDQILHGFYHYRARNNAGYLYLIGNGKDKRDIVRLIHSLNLNPYIQIVDPVFGKEKERVLSDIDVFIHPSRWDVMPTAAIEAAFHGKPLIVSSETGLSALIHQYQAGHVVHENTPLGIYTAMNNINKKSLPHMGYNAYTMAMNELCLEKNMPTYMRTLYGE